MQAGDVSYLISLRDEFSSKLGNIQKHTEQFDKQIGGLKHTLKEVAGLMVGAFAVGGALEFLKSSRAAYDKLEASVTRVNTVLASTKGAAGLSSEQIESQAKELSKGIVASRSEILDAQGMLLSFTGIKGPIFSETTKAVADFATFYKTDMTSAALSIGKAMNDPAMGMNRLQRQGVTFTAQQKEQVKIYEQQGNLLAAQRIILAELNREFGGQAKSFAMTDEGKLKMAAKRWSDIKLTLGEMISKIQISLIPTFNKMIDGFKSFLPYIKDAFQLIGAGIMGAINLLEKFGPVLKYIIGLFLLWKASAIFEFLITGAAKYLKFLTDIPGAVKSITTEFKNLRVSVFTSLAALLLLNETIQTIKAGGYGNRGRQLAAPLIEQMQVLAAKEEVIKANRDKYEKGTAKYESLNTYLQDLKKQEDEIGNKIYDLEKSGLGGGLNRLTEGLKQQFNGLMKGLFPEDIKKEQEKLSGGKLENQENPNLPELTKIESAAPKIFNININKMTGVETIETKNISESASNIGQAILNELVEALNDVQITANL